MGKVTRGLLLAVALAVGASCMITPRTAANIASAAIWTAAIAGTIVMLDAHDGHYHYEHCGHYRRYHDERWVYYYQDRWEYYDEPTGAWYIYAD